MNNLASTLAAIRSQKNFACINQVTRGIEKESLRITPEGVLAQTPHPPTLGSALTHPFITTDYSEALLEFITQPSINIQENLQSLESLHAYTYQHIGNERLWVTSMPCVLGNDKDIPIAQYGLSNSGQMKAAYRMGLGHRYGRSMQTIAGIHYNFSVADELWEYLQAQAGHNGTLQDFKTEGYFRLIRNFRRYFWLLLYLFGASPSVCKSFVKNRSHQLVPFGEDEHSLHTPFATSLRMGDLGYQSNAQDSLVITYNCLNSYAKTLCQAITQPHPQYSEIGIKNGQGEYQQLNDSLLQIENEFYSVIRPKRTAARGETALAALVNGGIEYIEVRCLDINPFLPVGIDQEQIHFLDTFLLFCLLNESPLSDEAEYADIQENQKRMVYDGRNPELNLLDQGQERNIREWGHNLLAELNSVAELVDLANESTLHSDSVAKQKAKMDDAELTPSAQILAAMKAQKMTFYRFAAEQSLQHQQYFAHYDLGNTKVTMANLAETSLQQQTELEEDHSVSFDEYLANYYSQYQCGS